MIDIVIEKELLGAQGRMQMQIALQIERGSFVALSGESGSGKTTLLRILAGLESARGCISVEGRRWLEGSFSLPPQQREIGFVFQEYALFENMSVLGNLLFVRKDRTLARHLLRLTGLEGLEERHPHSLSGGQKQRVSLCRAFMKRPKLLLMDEPLSALDPQMRSRLQQEILSLHREFGTTTIMVSHDQSEIYHMADRLLVLERGSIVRDDTPRALFLQHGTPHNCTFEGEILDIVRADLLYLAIVSIGQQIVKVPLTQAQAKQLEKGARVTIAAHPFSPVIL